MTRGKGGHVVCVARVHGALYAFSNLDAILLSSDEISDVGRIVAARMNTTLDYVVKAEGFSIKGWHEE